MTAKPTSYPGKLEERLEREWKAYDEYYCQQTLPHPYFYHQQKRERAFVECLVSRFCIGAGKTLVDVGCGNGLYSHLFQRRGLIVTGVDLSQKAIDYCVARYGTSCEWLCSDAFALGRDGSYDYAFCFWFMYFNAFDVPTEGASAGARLMQLLKPGGELFFLWHSDLTAVRLPAERFSVMNYTMAQLKTFFSGYSVEGYAVDSPALACRILGKYSFNKYVTRLSCARVQLQDSSWKRARLLLVVRR